MASVGFVVTAKTPTNNNSSDWSLKIPLFQIKQQSLFLTSLFLLMASVRLTQRLPTRPSAEKSPSPDTIIKTIIPNTTSPRIKKQHYNSKKDQDESLIKIREENKKLREEMKHLLGKNKQQEEHFTKQKDLIKKQEEANKSKSYLNQRPTEKHTSRSFVKNSDMVSVSQVKQQLSTMIREKQRAVYNKIKQLQKRITINQQAFQNLHNRMSSPGFGTTKTSSKKKTHFESSPRARGDTSSHLEQQGDQLSQSRNYTTPIKGQSQYKELIRELESELSNATQTIQRLETILQTQERSVSSVKFRTQKNDLLLSQLKQQNQNLVLELKSAYKGADDNRKSIDSYLEEIERLQNVINQLKNQSSSKGREIKLFRDAEKQLMRKHQLEIINIKKQFEDRKEDSERRSRHCSQANRQYQQQKLKIQAERRRFLEEIQILQNKLSETSKILYLVEKDLQQEKNQKSNVEQELKKVKKNLFKCEQALQQLKQENSTLRQNQVSLKKQIDQINDLNGEFSSQRSEIQSLSLQLTSALNNIEALKDEHRTQSSSYLKQIKSIRELTQNIRVPDQVKKQEEPLINNQLNLAVNQHKNQILRLQSAIHNLSTQKQLLASSLESLSKQNSTLKDQIRQLQQSIQKYANSPRRQVMKAEQIQSIILSQQFNTTSKISQAAKTMSTVSNRLNILYQQIGVSQFRTSGKRFNDSNSN